MTRPASPAGGPWRGERVAPAPDDTARNHFFALLPPPEVRDALAAIAAGLPEAVGGRPEPAHRLHLTLFFLGPLPAAVHDDALRAAGHAARGASAPFEVEVDHLGRFARSDVVWAGPSSPPDRGLQALHAALRRACAGVPVTRPPGRFSPHVTLLRNAARDAQPPETPIGPFRWRAERFVLLRTEPSPAGRRYVRIAEWPIAGAAG
jgi:2'-5' RNA ligase